jgi:hypothetical protein
VTNLSSIYVRWLFVFDIKSAHNPAFFTQGKPVSKVPVIEKVTFAKICLNFRQIVKKSPLIVYVGRKFAHLRDIW